MVEFDSLEAQTNRFRCYGYFYLFHFGFLLYSNNLSSPKYKKYADKCLLLLYKYVLLLRSRLTPVTVFPVAAVFINHMNMHNS